MIREAVSLRQHRTLTVLSATGACLYHDAIGTKGIVEESVIAAFKNSIDSFSDRVQRVVEQRLEVHSHQDAGGDPFQTHQRQQQQHQRPHGVLQPGASEEHKNARAAQNILSRHQLRGSFTFGEDRFVFQPVDAFVLVINAPQASGETVILRQLEDLVNLFVLLFGPPEKWRPASLRLNGIKSMIDRILLGDAIGLGDTSDEALRDDGFRERTRSLLGGVPFLSMSSQTQEHVDQLLAMLENDNSTLGSALLVEGSVLHSRLDVEETMQVWTLVDAQPLSYQRTRVTPIYSENQWKNLVVYRMRWHTLCVLQAIECTLVDVLPKLERFDRRLNERMSQLQIPIAATTPQIDEFAGLETLALAFHSVGQGRTLIPALRADATAAQYGDVFYWFLQRAQDQMRGFGVGQVQLTKAGYRFYAAEENGFELYLLCGDECSAGEIEDEADRIVAQIRMTQSV